jgi:hypothetical protein
MAVEAEVDQPVRWIRIGKRVEDDVRVDIGGRRDARGSRLGGADRDADVVGRLAAARVQQH